MNNWKTIADIRREYGELRLNKKIAHQCPITQFKRWFEEGLATEKSDPTAMVLSTVDTKGHPDSRVVLLKGLDEGCFIFYTNYQSKKGLQIQHSPYVALNFYWPQLVRQVRIRGSIEPVSSEQSDRYFASRPIKSQLSAMVSPQSCEIANRYILEEAFNKLIIEYEHKLIERPAHWGGYRVHPEEIEFWQGHDNRLHDRILYHKKEEKWTFCRLAP